MTYKFTIDGKLPGLNDYTAANRTNPKKGNRMKRDSEIIIIWSIRQYYHRLHINCPVRIEYHFFEKMANRDKDNIASFAMKVIQDSLVKSNVIDDDGWKSIDSFSCAFSIDKINPRIEVKLIEVGD